MFVVLCHAITPVFRILGKTVAFLICLLICGYVFLPVSLVFCPHVVDFFVFLNHVALPFTRNFSDFAHFGLNHVQCSSHHVDTPDGAHLGVWLIQPPVGVESRRQVVLYHHGNSGTRGTPHRIILYKILANAGFDVVTFDYRGYADSGCNDDGCLPSEQGLLTDSRSVYEWTLRNVNDDKGSVIFWGHSLGGGAATNLARSLCPDVSSNCADVGALVLESTFSDVVDAAIEYPIAWPLQLYEPALLTLKDSLAKRNLQFNNTATLGRLRLPVLMVHAEDDVIVPPLLSHRAFHFAKSVRPASWPAIEYKLFSAKFGYGHRSLHDAPDLVATVVDFVTKNAKLKVE